MTLLDDIFNDLIDDLNKWKKNNKNEDSVLNRLEILKYVLEEQIDTLKNEISEKKQEQEQDLSWARADEILEEMRIREYE